LICRYLIGEIYIQNTKPIENKRRKNEKKYGGMEMIKHQEIKIIKHQKYTTNKKTHTIIKYNQINA